MSFFSSLTRQQKEAMGLLQIGTFLEYFDLLLYVHMAVLLNELFFPKTDPFTASLLAAFAFCSTYVLRPFGALLLGYIGDNFGRKQTVIITSLMMACSCIVMANLPTYAQMGIAATWIVTLCRVLQGMSSLGEIVSAEVYLAEITKPPERYPVVAWVRVFADMGALMALAIASFVTSFGLNWRIAFWVGASIALFGSAARTRLRETPEFLEKRLQKTKAPDKIITNIDKKTALAMLLIFCNGPLFFYFSYIYSAQILENSFGYTVEQIIHQNFFVCLVELIEGIILASLSYRFYPLNIVKIKLGLCFLFVLFLPFLLNNITMPFHLFFLQIGIIFAAGAPAYGIFYAHFPVLKRVTSVSFLFAISRAAMYIVTSFGLIYLTAWMGYWGLWVVMFPSLISIAWAIKHFEKIDRPERKRFELPEETFPLEKAA